MAGALYGIRVEIQDGTGSRTLAFHALYTFPGTITPILNPAAGAATVLLFFYDGTAFRYCNASGDHKLANLYLAAQAAAGSDQRPIYIDSTGKLQKSGFVNYSESAKKATITGASVTNIPVFEALNSSLAVIMKLYNDQIAEFGGPTAVISILSGIASGGAYLEINSNQTEGFKIVDKAGNMFLTFVTTTGQEAVILGKRLKQNFTGSFERWHIQAFIRTTTTAGGVNLISFVNLPTDFAVSLKVDHLFAYATDGAAVVAAGGREGLARNVAGTVSGAFASFTVLADPATTATFSLVADNTNKRININFHNTTGTGKTFDVSLDYTYILNALPEL